MNVAVETLISPLDRARAATYRVLGRPLRGLIARREDRVLAYGLLGTFMALAFTSLCPLWLLALGPLVLGVPHLLSDFRYLVARRGYHRRPLLLVSVAALLIVVSITPRFAIGALVALPAILFARASLARRGVALAIFVVIYVGARRLGLVADYAFAHLHNLIAIGLWLAWRRRGARVNVIVPLAFVAGAAAIFSGGVEQLVIGVGAVVVPRTGLDFGELVYALAAPWADAHPLFALRMVLFFAFAQSVHYGVWLRLVPEDDRGREAPRSFGSTYRALRADLGAWPLLLLGLLALGLIGYALHDLRGARDGYLRIAAFHGYLELAAIALFALEGTPGATDRRLGAPRPAELPA
jgi:hypothetical protein